MSFRPGFMTVTILVATIATPGIGFVADRVAPQPSDDATTNVLVEADFARHGWRPAELVWPSTHHLAHRIEDQSGVRVFLADQPFELALAHGPIHCQAASEPMVHAALSVIEQELSKYPSACLHRAHFRGILLCRDLYEGWMSIPSLPNYRNTLLLDANATAPYLQRVVHHEIFHFVDFVSRGNLAEDPSWTSLNAPSFEYGGGGRVLRSVPSDWQQPHSGFVSFYAQSAVEEDKAEVFSMWMTQPDRLRALAARDDVVLAKTETLRDEVVALCPGMQTRLPAVTAHR